MTDLISHSTSQGVTTITIQRRAERNALNVEVVAQLREAFERFGNDASSHVILLQGEGQEAFCAGADLKELGSRKSIVDIREFFCGIASLIETIVETPKPVIAKVHGYAMAGGCGLAAACDLVIASDDAKFGLPEIKLGIAPMMIMAPLSRAIGRKVLADLTLSGDTIDARRALEIGLVSRVVAKAELDEAAEALATKIASYSPLATATAKEGLSFADEVELSTALHLLAEKVTVLAASEDGQTGITSFLNKTKPEWRGR